MLGSRVKYCPYATVVYGPKATAPRLGLVCAGLLQLEDNQTRLAALRAALADGENSGTSIAFDVEAFFLKTSAKKPRVKLRVERLPIEQ